jgi:hypothetical protein
MARIEPLLAPPLQWQMRSYKLAVLEDADLVRQDVHIEDAPPCGVRHAVEIAADAHHAFMRSSPLEAEHGSVGHAGQGLKRRSFGEGLIDDPLGRCVHAGVGDRVEPMAELVVEILEIAKDAAEKEVLADIRNGRSTLPFVLAR